MKVAKTMNNDSETVREVYERTVGYNQMCSFGCHEKETVKRIANNFISAHEREMAAKDDEIERLKEERNHARLDAQRKFSARIEMIERALKPVMNACAEDAKCDAVREARRIMKESYNGESHN